MIDFAVVIAVGLPVVVASVYLMYHSGLKGIKHGHLEERYNTKETPDSIFVRGTKGILITAIVFWLVGSYSEGSFQWEVATLFVLPAAIAYIVGLIMAHSAAKSRMINKEK